MMNDGFICLCGKRHKFNAYVAAHFNERLTFICPKCGKAWVVLGGVVSDGAKVAKAIPGKRRKKAKR